MAMTDEKVGDGVFILVTSGSRKVVYWHACKCGPTAFESNLIFHACNCSILGTSDPPADETQCD
jgi:hypothetical protein